MEQLVLPLGKCDGLETAHFTHVSKKMVVSDGYETHTFQLALSRCGGEHTKMWFVSGLRRPDGQEFRVTGDDGYTVLQIAYDIFFLGETSYDVSIKDFESRFTDGVIPLYGIYVMNQVAFTFDPEARSEFQMFDRYDFED